MNIETAQLPRLETANRWYYGGLDRLTSKKRGSSIS